jgi:hypothetical protein
MKPEWKVEVPALAPDFAQRVLRQAKRLRRRNATLHAVLGLGASLAVATLVARPGRVATFRAASHSPVSGVLGLASTVSELGEGDGSEEGADEDPGVYFFPDAQVEAQLAVESPSEGELADLGSVLEGGEE